MRVGTFTAVLHEEGDLDVADCPEVGTVSQGKTVEEAVANLQEATELYLEEFPLGDHGRPLVTMFEARFAWIASPVGCSGNPRFGKDGFRASPTTRESRCTEAR
jgi:predicted RNase H-like HicB family nuclease